MSDRSSGKNIKWCTDNYSDRGDGFRFGDFISMGSLEGTHGKLVVPRVLKSRAEQQTRSKNMAEVFTPSWVCNRQNNLIDDIWFGRSYSFNTEAGSAWIPTDRVVFFGDKTWQKYVDLERIEITCGEAPYLTSRYDTTTGDYIPVRGRIGLLDRKLRVISENVDDEPEWFSFAKEAFKRVYGYEYQGDNLLIARENMLFSFIEFYQDKFEKDPTPQEMLEIAEIISWNIWQMDGLKFVVPDSCHEESRLSLIPGFGDEPEMCYGCQSGNNLRHNGIYCLITDWKANKIIRFIDLVRGGRFYGC